MIVAVALLVRPGADPRPALAALRAAAVEDVDVVAHPAPGAGAAARNAALERAADADVLAFVEDDVQVGPLWGAAVRAAWDDARVAVAGGPVVAAGAPPWLVPAGHGEVLGLASPAGDAPRFVAGNVAFRVAALRGVGGFFPVRGHPDARDSLGDDRRAQEELAAVGWRALAVDGMAAERDLAELRPADLLRRRLRAGARARALAPPDGGSHAGSAAWRLLGRAGAAAAVRGARGDRRGALDRAAWAAGGLGGILGRALVHAELQPDRPQTALRAAVAAPAPAGPASLARVRRGVRDRARAHAPVLGAILLYHRVAEVEADPLALAVTPAHFAQQLDALRAGWTPVTLEALLAGDAGPHAVALTFDDGYHDNLAHAVPALRAAGIPATLFASTGHVAGGHGFWWDELTRLLRRPGADVLALALPEGARAWAPRDAEQRVVAAGHVRAALQTRDPATIAAALATIRAWAGDAPTPAAPPARDRPLTVAELGTLAAGDGPFTVAAHGRTHVSLAHAPPAVRDAELTGSADDLAAWLGTRPSGFSYPFGVPGVDVDPATRAAARAAGYRYATVNAPGLARRGGDPLALPRLAVADVDGATFARWLQRAFPGR